MIELKNHRIPQHSKTLKYAIMLMLLGIMLPIMSAGCINTNNVPKRCCFSGIISYYSLGDGELLVDVPRLAYQGNISFFRANIMRSGCGESEDGLTFEEIDNGTHIRIHVNAKANVTPQPPLYYMAERGIGSWPVIRNETAVRHNIYTPNEDFTLGSSEQYQGRTETHYSYNITIHILSTKPILNFSLDLSSSVPNAPGDGTRVVGNILRQNGIINETFSEPVTEKNIKMKMQCTLIVFT